MRVSHETIYLSLYVQARGALRKELTRSLRRGHTNRRRRGHSISNGRGDGCGNGPRRIAGRTPTWPRVAVTLT